MVLPRKARQVFGEKAGRLPVMMEKGELMKNQYILFDLDGTLTDPKEGITKSVQYALAKMGIAVDDPDTLCPFIGPPLAESFQKFYQMNEEESLLAVKNYREYFSVRGIFENEVYEGIPEMLKALQEAGRTLIVATSKPTDYAERILEHFQLDDYFDFVAGATMDGSRVRKQDVIQYALEELELIDLSELVMVGDRMHDILGAKEFDIPTIGVLYGYGSREELEKAGAEELAKSVKDLQELLLEED